MLHLHPLIVLYIIWDELSKQHNNQRIKRHDIYCPIKTLLVQLKCRFNVQLSWESPFLKLSGPNRRKFMIFGIIKKVYFFAKNDN